MSDVSEKQKKIDIKQLINEFYELKEEVKQLKKHIMEFGVPKRRELTAKKEKYENISVLTVTEFKGKGTGRIIQFNDKSIESLGLDLESNEAQVSFSFDTLANKIFVANTTGHTDCSEVRIAKTSKSTSDKKYFEAIKAHFNVALKDQVELKLIKTEKEFNGFPVFELEVLKTIDALKEATEDTVEYAKTIEESFNTTEEPNEATELRNLGASDELANNNTEIEINNIEVEEEVINQEIDSEVDSEIDNDPFANFVKGPGNFENN